MFRIKRFYDKKKKSESTANASQTYHNIVVNRGRHVSVSATPQSDLYWTWAEHHDRQGQLDQQTNAPVSVNMWYLDFSYSEASNKPLTAYIVIFV